MVRRPRTNKISKRVKVRISCFIDDGNSLLPGGEKVPEGRTACVPSSFLGMRGASGRTACIPSSLLVMRDIARVDTILNVKEKFCVCQYSGRYRLECRHLNLLPTSGCLSSRGALQGDACARRCSGDLPVISCSRNKVPEGVVA